MGNLPQPVNDLRAVEVDARRLVVIERVEAGAGRKSITRQPVSVLAQCEGPLILTFSPRKCGEKEFCGLLMRGEKIDSLS